MLQDEENARFFSLTDRPEGAVLNAVTAEPAEIAGRRALRVSLTDDVTLHGKPNVDYVDMPTFVRLPVPFRNGVISVDILARLNRHAPDYARGFAGLAYRIADDGERFEAVYLRPLNGLKANPPSPRDRRAVQYFAYPDWRFERLRETHPDGRYEAGADIGPDTWHTLTLEIEERTVIAKVDGVTVLSIEDAKAAPIAGAVGLFVDIGTEAFFANLRVQPR
jgi:hypothetical protein